MAEKPSVYIETSAVSYLVARPSNDVVKLGHPIITVEWRETRLPKTLPRVSKFVLSEAGRGDPALADRRLKALAPFDVPVNSVDAQALAKVYQAEKLVPESEPIDALHLAPASVYAFDYLVTWNCRHIASASVLRRGCSGSTLVKDLQRL